MNSDAERAARKTRGLTVMSPVRLQAIILATVFLLEIAITVALSALRLHQAVWWILDASLLSILVFAALHFLVFRPLLRVLRSLHDGERLYRALFETSRDAIMTLEPPSWKFTSGNPATVKMFRATNERDFVAHAPWALSPEQQPDGCASSEKAKEMIETAMREGSHFFEWTHARIGGEEFPATVLLTRLYIGEKSFLQATVRDITRQERAEAALRASEQRYRALFDGAAEGILVADAGTRKFRYANPAICALLGYTEKELTGMVVGQIHPEENLPAVFAAFEAQARGELQFAAALPCLRKSGEIFYADINTAAVELESRPFLVGFFTDVTARRRAEQALHASREKFRSIVDHIGIGVALISPRLEILELNRQMKEWFPSVTPGDGILCYAHFNAPPRPEPCAYCPTIKTLRDGRVHEAITETPAGEQIRRYRVISSPVLDAEGSVTAAIEMVEDITDRMEMEAQLQQQQKLASVGTLARGMAHEINNPIMGIMNYAQLIQDRLGTESREAEFATEIGREAKRVATLVKNLLSFSSREPEAHRSPARIHDIVEGALSLVRTAMQEDNITLRVNVPDNLPLLKCRTQQIQQVIMSLLTNARDALNEKYPGCDDNKVIVLRAELETGEESLPSKLRPPHSSSRIRLTVEDHGPGIPDALRERMFEPFFTTKDRTQSAGLGLSVSHGIVREHGGELSVASEIGQWTRIHVDLPVVTNTDAGTGNEEGVRSEK